MHWSNCHKSKLLSCFLYTMLISWRPFSSDCGMLLHLTQNSRKELSGNQSGYISDGFMRKSAHKCANLTKPLRLQILVFFSTFDCKFVRCAFFVIVFVLVRQTSLTAKMGFMGISAQNSKILCKYLQYYEEFPAEFWIFSSTW